MAARRYGGRFSPDGAPAEGAKAGGTQAPAAPPFRNRRARNISLRARLMYALPIPLLLAGLGAIWRVDTLEMLADLGGFAGLMLAAWLLNEGLRAEAAFEARSVARPPAFPRKLAAAVLAGISLWLVASFGLGRSLVEGLALGAVGGFAHVVAFGLDPMKKKGLDGVDEYAVDRVARAIDKAEALVGEINGAAARIGDRRLEARVERLCDQARDVFRVVENDPRDLPRARTFLSVYLLGLRDATRKFAEIYGRSRSDAARQGYEALLGDLETSFSAHRARLLEDDRSDLDVEIEVLRERLQHDGLTTG